MGRVVICGCGRSAYRPDAVTTRRMALRCSGCHRLVGRCSCAAPPMEQRTTTEHAVIQEAIESSLQDSGYTGSNRLSRACHAAASAVIAALAATPTAPALDVDDLHAADMAASLVHDYIWQKPVLSGTTPPSQQQASDAIWTIHKVLRPLLAALSPTTETPK